MAALFLRARVRVQQAKLLLVTTPYNTRMLLGIFHFPRSCLPRCLRRQQMMTQVFGPLQPCVRYRWSCWLRHGCCGRLGSDTPQLMEDLLSLSLSFVSSLPPSLSLRYCVFCITKSLRNPLLFLYYIFYDSSTRQNNNSDLDKLLNFVPLFLHV